QGRDDDRARSGDASRVGALRKLQRLAAHHRRNRALRARARHRRSLRHVRSQDLRTGRADDRPGLLLGGSRDMVRLRRALAPLAIGGLLALGSGGPLAAGARAGQPVRLTATFAPNRLGADATVGLGFRVLGSAGGIPSPIHTIDLRYPAELAIALSGLGVAT